MLGPLEWGDAACLTPETVERLGAPNRLLGAVALTGRLVESRERRLSGGLLPRRDTEDVESADDLASNRGHKRLRAL
jgi:hypothetical protein